LLLAMTAVIDGPLLMAPDAQMSHGSGALTLPRLP
jgi:hypothetical protein